MPAERLWVVSDPVIEQYEEAEGQTPHGVVSTYPDRADAHDAARQRDLLLNRTRLGRRHRVAEYRAVVVEGACWRCGADIGQAGVLCFPCAAPTSRAQGDEQP